MNPKNFLLSEDLQGMPPRESDAFCDQVIAQISKRISGPFNLFYVGCLDGYEADYIQKRVVGCSTYCFDPMQSALFIGASQHVLAIGCTDGPMQFWEAQEGMSSLYDRGGTERTVEAKRIDTFCRENGITSVDVLSIDTEGTAWDVIESCGDMLATCKVIECEMQYVEMYKGQKWSKQIIPLLEKSGFTHLDHSEAGYSAGSQGNDFFVREGASRIGAD